MLRKSYKLGHLGSEKLLIGLTPSEEFQQSKAMVIHHVGNERGALTYPVVRSSVYCCMYGGMTLYSIDANMTEKSEAPATSCLRAGKSEKDER